MLDTITNIKVIGEGKSGEEAVQLIRKISPDVVLMDVRIPGMGGLKSEIATPQRNSSELEKSKY